MRGMRSKKELQEQFEKVVGVFNAQVKEQMKELDGHVAAFKKKLADADIKIDKEQIEKLTGQLATVAMELQSRSSQFRGELKEVKSKAKTTVSALTAQLKALAEAERAKRRGKG